MRREGVTPKDAAAAGLEGQLYDGVKLCASCEKASICRQWLANLGGSQFEVNCPNKWLFDRIRRHRDSVPKKESPLISPL